MPLCREDLQVLQPYAHAVDEAALAPHPGLGRVVRLGSNENPLGPSPAAVQAMHEAAALAGRYPQADNGQCLAAMAAHLGLPAANLVAGNGGDECLDLLLRAAACPAGLEGVPDAVLACRPCFDVYRTQALVCGLRFIQAPLKPDFSLPLDALARLAHETPGRVTVVFATSPDNPSGVATPRDALLKLARSLPAHALLLVDEAYVDFCENPDAATCLPFVPELPNLGVLRTFSKAYGLAGARLGFMALPRELAGLCRRVQIPFSVNRFAQTACLAALQDREHYRRSVALVESGRNLLTRELRSLGCETPESQANFVMLRPPMDAGLLFNELLARGILVRNLAPNGLAGWLRVTVGLQEECAAFLDAVREILALHDA